MSYSLTSFSKISFSVWAFQNSYSVHELFKTIIQFVSFSKQNSVNKVSSTIIFINDNEYAVHLHFWNTYCLVYGNLFYLPIQLTFSFPRVLLCMYLQQKRDYFEQVVLQKRHYAPIHIINVPEKMSSVENPYFWSLSHCWISSLALQKIIINSIKLSHATYILSEYS